MAKENTGALGLLRRAVQRNGALRPELKQAVASAVNGQTPTPAVLEATSSGPRTWASRTSTPRTGINPGTRRCERSICGTIHFLLNKGVQLKSIHSRPASQHSCRGMCAQPRVEAQSNLETRIFIGEVEKLRKGSVDNCPSFS